MIVQPTPAVRQTRAPQGKAADGDTKARQDALNDRQLHFDVEAAEQAELQREQAALEALMMAEVKQEDAIMKKWIEMI